MNIKSILKLLFVPLILNSCNSGRYVAKVVYNFNMDTTCYINKNGENIVKLGKNPAIYEGSKIQVFVIGFNPLAFNVSSDKSSPALYYQEIDNSTLKGFLSLTDESSNKAKDISPASTGTEKVKLTNRIPLPNSNDSLSQSLDSLRKIKNAVDSSIDRYKSFYNAVIELNNVLEQLKYVNKLDSQCLCFNIDSKIKSIKDKFFDHSNHQSFYCGKLVSCGDSLWADEITYQKSAYYDYFKIRLNTLDSIQAVIRVQKAAMIKSFGKEVDKGLAKYLKDMKNPELSKLIENDGYIDFIKTISKEINDLKDAYLSKQSNDMDLAINKYKAIGFIEFKKNLGYFKVEETDEFILPLNFANSITNSTTVRQIDLDVIKPLKIDFSAGVFMAGLYDENYDVVKNDSTHYSLSKLNNGKVSYGAIGYINFHTQFCDWLSFGASVGTGLMFNDASKIVFSPSLSFLFGKYQRAILHIGCGIAQVDRVHSLYSSTFTDASYKPEIKKEISAKWLISLTWNLSRK